ncbi:MAG: tetratricopeptide repeat protein [Candidatus Margulisbacteria bacterium]|nr:tetratricopeptide repeat protein [Candidatus Margulisiibacteriota bacterium]
MKPKIIAAVQNNKQETLLKPDNQIRKLFLLEAEIFKPEEVELAYERFLYVLNIMKIVLVKPENNHKPVIEKIQIAYEILEGCFRFAKENESCRTYSIVDSLLNEILDCDAGCFFIMALAKELARTHTDWKKVKIVSLQEYSYLDVNGTVLDFGEVKLKADFIEKFHLAPDDAFKLLTPFEKEEMPALFYYNLAYQHYLRFDIYESMKALGQAIKLKPDYAPVYNLRGYMYLLSDELNLALKDLNKALKFHHNFVNALVNRGAAYHTMGNYKHALEDYNRAIEIDPDQAETYSFRGSLFLTLGYYQKAIIDFSIAIELDPEDMDARLSRALAYIRNDQEHLAADDIQLLQQNKTYLKKLQKSGIPVIIK